MQRMNISLPDEMVRQFKRQIPAGKRSQFITEAVSQRLGKKDIKKELIKSLKSSVQVYEEIKKDWEPLDVEGWPD